MPDGDLMTKNSAVHPGYAFSAPVVYDITPSYYGFSAWTQKPELVQSGTTPAAGLLIMSRLYVPVSFTAATLHLFISAIAVTPTASQNWAGLYSSSGTLLGSTAALDAKVLLVGDINMALTVQGGQSLALVAGTSVYVGSLFNAATQPGLACVPGLGNGMLNLALSNATSLCANDSGGHTTLPTSVTMSSLSARNTYVWAALS